MTNKVSMPASRPSALERALNRKNKYPTPEQSRKIEEKKMLKSERKRKAALAAATGYSSGGKIKMDAQYKSAGGTIFKGR